MDELDTRLQTLSPLVRRLRSASGYAMHELHEGISAAGPRSGGALTGSFSHYTAPLRQRHNLHVGLSRPSEVFQQVEGILEIVGGHQQLREGERWHSPSMTHRRSVSLGALLAVKIASQMPLNLYAALRPMSTSL
jgi:hypothetical protein